MSPTQPPHLGDVVKTLRRWNEGHQDADVEFTESDAPDNDPSDDYEIAYEARWRPLGPNSMAIEVWVAPDGSVAFGLGSRERLAQRLGVANRRAGFVAGCEPVPMSRDAVLAVLDAVAAGQVAVLSSVFPLVGLGSTAACVLAQGPVAVDRLATIPWLGSPDDLEGRVSAGKVVRYAPWSSDTQDRATGGRSQPRAE